MSESTVINEGVAEGDGSRKERLIKRHAKESWLYPVITFSLGIFGAPFIFLNVVTIPMGIYCLIKSYVNVKNGRGQGILKHVVVGTVLNIVIVAINVVVFYALIFH